MTTAHTATGSAANLLVACTGQVGVPGHESRILEAARHVSDWKKVIELAHTHRMIPFLQAALDGVPRGTCPEDVLTQLRRLSMANAARNVFLVKELARLLDLLRTSGIPAIPFKGPILAQMLHGDSSLRQVDDLDILLRCSDIGKAADLLISRGFAPRIALTGTQREAHLRAGWGYSLHNPEKQYFLELDSNVASRSFSLRIDPDWFFDNLHTVTIADGAFQTLSAENYVVLLCAHGTKHQWQRLIWITDLMALIQKRILDWPLILQRAEASGTRRMVLLGVALARTIGDVALPPEARRALEEDPMADELAGEIADRLRCRGETGWSGLAGLEFQLQSRNRWCDRLRFLSAMIFAPTYSDWRALRLPRRLFPLYYLIRPFRLAGELVLGKRRAASG